MLEIKRNLLTIYVSRNIFKPSRINFLPTNRKVESDFWGFSKWFFFRVKTNLHFVYRCENNFEKGRKVIKKENVGREISCMNGN